MLTSEFSQELAALIRSLQDRIRMEAFLGPIKVDGTGNTTRLDHARDDLDAAIIRLIALRLSL